MRYLVLKSVPGRLSGTCDVRESYEVTKYCSPQSYSREELNHWGAYMCPHGPITCQMVMKIPTCPLPTPPLKLEGHCACPYEPWVLEILDAEGIWWDNQQHCHGWEHMHSECHRLQPMNIVMLNINIFCMCVEGRVMSQNIRPNIIAMYAGGMILSMTQIF